MGSDPDCTITARQNEGDELILESDGLAVAARVFRPRESGPRPAIVICHGFGSRKENHAEFAQAAAQAGFVALTLDFRGHGASDGCLDSRTLNDLGCAVSWLSRDEQVDADRIVIRGSSMGGYFAIHAAARWDKIAAVVAICPATERDLISLLREIRDPNTAYGQWRASGEGFPRVMGCDLSCWLDAANIHQAIAEISPRPLLLVHAEGDETIPIASSERLFQEAAEPKTFWIVPGGDHRFAQNDPETHRRTLDWLAERI